MLRFVGLLNAAVWLGAMCFFTFVIGPTFFSDEVKNLLTLPRAGAAAQIMVERYLVLQQWCAGIALAHLLAEWLYNQGRMFPRAALIVLIGCLGISLAGSRLLAPQMKQLHLVKYAVQTTPEQKAAAARSFAILHGTSQVTNLLALLGVLYYYWKLSVGGQGSRTGTGTGRFRP